MSNPTLLGKFLAANWAKRGMTIRMLAKAAGTSPATVSALEHGLVKQPRRATLRRIATALGVDWQDVYTFLDDDLSPVDEVVAAAVALPPERLDLALRILRVMAD